MSRPELRRTRCALCLTEGNATEIYPSSFDPEALTPLVFSARRAPDRIHSRIVRCNSCGLLRSDPVVAPEILEDLYAKSSFDYAGELANLRFTYGRLLARALPEIGTPQRLLEIGCGNGFFLEEALAQGFQSVKGVEPSRCAAEEASDHIHPHLTVSSMRPGLFEPGQFDVVCMFHVLDHLPDPGALLDECHRLLRPGGLIICVAHDATALSAKLLGERSPIVDIEHTYLFSRGTATKLFSAHGFEVRSAGSLHNRYSAAYLAHLFPIPAGVKRLLLAILRWTMLGRVPVTLQLGNFHLLGRKPESLSPG